MRNGELNVIFIMLLFKKKMFTGTSMRTGWKLHKNLEMYVSFTVNCMYAYSIIRFWRMRRHGDSRHRTLFSIHDNTCAIFR